MLYLRMDYQLHLIIIIFFSASLIFQAIIYRGYPALRLLGFSFITSFFLASASFLVAPINYTEAYSLLVLSQFFLLILLSIVSFMDMNKAYSGSVYLIPFILTLLALLFNDTLSKIFNKNTVLIISIILLLIQLVFLIFHILSKSKQSKTFYLGLIVLCLSQISPILFNSSLLFISTFLLLLAFILILVFYYQNTTLKLLRQHHENTVALNRMNASLHLEVVRRVEEIEKSNRKLLEISKTDSMTGLYVKSAILNSLESHIERSPNTPIALILLDIDYFKTVNDTMGHQVGDRCIKALSALAQGSFRNADILGRYGGDEFIILLPATQPVKAFVIADRFRQLVDEKTQPHFTISVGVSLFPDDAKTSMALVEAADKALYASKQKGRNQVTLYSSLLANNPQKQ